MNGLFGVFQSLSHVVDRFEFLVLDLNEPYCFSCCGLIGRGNTGNQISDVTHFLLGHRVFVLGHRKHTESSTGILPGGHSDHSRQLYGGRDVDGQHSGIVML